jgi:anti-sigma factor RsiW
MSKHPISEADLHAYIDGALTHERRIEVERWLADHPGEAEKVRAYREQRELIKSRFDPVMAEEIPARLRNFQDRSFSFHAALSWVSDLARFPAQHAFAAILLCLTGGLAGWTAHGAFQPGMTNSPMVATGSGPAVQNAGLPRQAAIAHVVYSPEVMRPVEIGAEQEDQLIAWLSKRMGTPIRPPKLSALGYELIGGRLLPGANGPVAQFMYHTATGSRLTLYVSTEYKTDDDQHFRFTREGPVNVFYWMDGKFGLALSAGIDESELAKVAAAVREQRKPA